MLKAGRRAWVAETKSCVTGTMGRGFLWGKGPGSTAKKAGGGVGAGAG